MKKIVSLVILVAVCATYTWAQEAKSKELGRVEAATKVLDEIMAAPDKGIPQEILQSAECVVVIPSMLKAGFGFGGRYGRGISTCRTGANTWSAPAPVRVEGGSWGLQIGGEAIDLVMLVMNQQGMQQLLKSKFKIGADASASAGPVGRHASASTDWKMRSEILTYSRSRGAFAGISLDGTVVKQDTDDTLALYGKYIPFEQILTGKVKAPAGTQQFLADVRKHFGEAKAEKAEKAEVKQERKENAAEVHRGATSGGMSGSASAQRSETSETQSGSSIASPPASRSQSTTTTTETTEKPAQPDTSSSASGMSSAAGSNEEVKAKIQQSLHDTPNLATSNVTVNVSDDQVTLSGSVPTERDKTAIRRLALQNANGRRVVDSDVTVK
jgi:lipid-binding SYLF domain-containing protein